MAEFKPAVVAPDLLLFNLRAIAQATDDNCLKNSRRGYEGAHYNYISDVIFGLLYS